MIFARIFFPRTLLTAPKTSLGANTKNRLEAYATLQRLFGLREYEALNPPYLRAIQPRDYPWELPRRDAARPASDTHDFAQRLSYSSCRRHQMPPVSSLRSLGARSSHWYMPQRASSPRA